MPQPRFDPYAVLGVAPEASQAEIRDRYRVLAHLLHPDRHQSAPTKVIEEAERHLREVNEAYRVLTREPDQAREDQARAREARLRLAGEREAKLRQALHQQAAERQTKRRRHRRRRLLVVALIVASCLLGGFFLVTSQNDSEDGAPAGASPSVVATTPSSTGAASSSALTSPPPSAEGDRIAPGTYVIDRPIKNDGTWDVTLTTINVDRGRLRIDVAYRNVSSTAQSFVCEPNVRREVSLVLASGSTQYARAISCTAAESQLYPPNSTHTSSAEFPRIGQSDMPFTFSWYPATWGTVPDIRLTQPGGS